MMKNVSRQRRKNIYLLLLAILVLASTSTSSFNVINATFSIPWMFIHGHLFTFVPAMLVSTILVIYSLRWGRNIYYRENTPFLAFLFGIASYILLSVISLEVAEFVLKSLAESTPASSGSGTVFSVLLRMSANLLYLGFVVCIVLLIASVMKENTEASLPSTKIERSLRMIVICTAFALVLYGSFIGNQITKKLALILGQKQLCYLIHSSYTATDCLLKIRVDGSLKGDENREGSFVIAELPHEITNLQSIDGKLAYSAKNDDGTSVIVYDGLIVSSAYKKVGLSIASIGGRLAYEAVKDGKEIIVFDGKEVGTQYYQATSPTDVGGKLAYVASRDGKKFFVVYEGKEYIGGNIIDVGGKLSFTTWKDGVLSVILNGKELGKSFHTISWIKEQGGHLLFQTVDANGKSSLHVDDKEYGREYDYFLGDYNDGRVLIGNKLAFSASRNGHNYIWYDGQEFGEKFADIQGPYKVHDQLAYSAKDITDGMYQLYVNGQPAGGSYSKYESIKHVAVSENGQVALLAQNDGEDIVILDGQEIFRGKFLDNYWGRPTFYGEKLLFLGSENRRGYFFVSGAKHDLDGFLLNYFAVIGNKLYIAAVAYSSNGEARYYLLNER